MTNISKRCEFSGIRDNQSDVYLQTKCLETNTLGYNFGKVLSEDIGLLESSFQRFSEIPIDLDLKANLTNIYADHSLTTIKSSVIASSHGTFDRRKLRKITFEPTEKRGWWFLRKDIENASPIKVSFENAWATYYGGVNNIVLGLDARKNLLRLTEHIIALKPGLGIDNLLIKVESDDPPLFKLGSIELLQALENAGIQHLTSKRKYLTVKEKVTMSWPDGAFIIMEPYVANAPLLLNLDCAIDYQNALGQQRIRFPVTKENFKIGVVARTNTSLANAILCKTLGKFSPSTKYLGYNKENILIVGRKKYYNEPQLIHNSKALEAIWHRAILDLLAAVALIGDDRFIGNITSFKAGHRHDVEFVAKLHEHNLLTEVNMNQ